MIKLLINGFKLLDHSHRRKGFRLVLLQLLASISDLVSLATFFPVVLLAVRSENLLTDMPLIGGISDKLPFAYLAIAITGFALLCIVLKTLFNIWITKKRALFAYEIAGEFATRSIVHFWNLPYTRYVTSDFSNEMNRLNNLPLTYANNFIIPCGVILSEGAVSILLTLAVAVYDIKIFLLLLSIMLPVLVVYLRKKKQVESTGDIVKKTYPLSLKKTMQAIEGWIEIKLLRKQKPFLNEYQKTFGNLGRAFADDYTAHTHNARTTELIAAICICVLASYLFLTSASAEAGMIMIMLYGGVAYRVIPSVNRILSAFIQIRTHRYAIESLSESLITPKLAVPSSGEIQFASAIEISNVSAGYANGAPVLKNASLKISRGNKIVLCGRSGSGKSTLLLLLMRLIREDQGNITVDGVKIDSHNEDSFRRLLGYVPQSPYMLSGTIAQNVAFTLGDEPVDTEKVQRLLAALDLGEWLNTLPTGLDTVIGEKGLQISGGQRQRIAIARALYHHSEILLLDEITNQLDLETELEVRNAMRSEEFQTKTIVLITHRPALWSDFDAVYYLRDGHFEKQLVENPAV